MRAKILKRHFKNDIVFQEEKKSHVDLEGFIDEDLDGDLNS